MANYTLFTGFCILNTLSKQAKHKATINDVSKVPCYSMSFDKRLVYIVMFLLVFQVYILNSNRF